MRCSSDYQRERWSCEWQWCRRRSACRPASRRRTRCCRACRCEWRCCQRLCCYQRLDTRPSMPQPWPVCQTVRGAAWRCEGWRRFAEGNARARQMQSEPDAGRRFHTHQQLGACDRRGSLPCKRCQREREPGALGRRQLVAASSGVEAVAARDLLRVSRSGLRLQLRRWQRTTLPGFARSFRGRSFKGACLMFPL